MCLQLATLALLWLCRAVEWRVQRQTREWLPASGPQARAHVVLLGLVGHAASDARVILGASSKPPILIASRGQATAEWQYDPW